MVENINYSELYELYLTGKSLEDLSKLFPVSRPTIKKNFINLGYKVRSHKESCKGTSSSQLSKQAQGKVNNYKWLYEQRIINHLSYRNIGKLCNCSDTVVIRYCKKFNIPHIRYNESEWKTKQILDSKSDLENLYKNNTCQEIAEKIGSSKGTVSKFLNKHQISIKPSNSYNRKFNKRSIFEIEVYDYIKGFGVQLEHNKHINGMEYDITCPSLKIAIECNGLYYHSSIFKDKSYHYNKTINAQSNNYKLIHIWEDDWRDKNELIKSQLKAIFKKLPKHIGARKCEIRKVDYIHTRNFLNTNHIQGYTKSKYNIGLYYKNMLCALMTFNSPRFNKAYDYELIRYSTLQNCEIMGGFSKLLKYFEKHYPGSIISYADISYSMGNVYEKNGFTELTRNPPSYYYIIDHFKKKVPRTCFKKSEFKSLCDVSKFSESDLTSIFNIPKIWNCGTIVYIKKRGNKSLSNNIT